MDGPLVIEPQIFKDPRGYFFESYNQQKFTEAGINATFIQDNQSLSQKGAIRGLHFQAPPFAQGKLVRVAVGAVNDVVVDIRKKSPTYGQFYSITLTGENNLMLWIPPGFAHGFETLEDNTLFLYKCTNLYNKASEGGLFYKDETIGINWQSNNPIVSDKDLVLPLLKDFISPF
jgi:dTDP-4-dehydrorhamnose 3,5-epimerase